MIHGGQEALLVIEYASLQLYHLTASNTRPLPGKTATVPGICQAESVVQVNAGLQRIQGGLTVVNFEINAFQICLFSLPDPSRTRQACGPPAAFDRLG